MGFPISANNLKRFASKKKDKLNPIIAHTNIHAELIPILYTRAGPPTNPNPLKRLENRANPVTTIQVFSSHEKILSRFSFSKGPNADHNSEKHVSSDRTEYDRVSK